MITNDWNYIWWRIAIHPWLSTAIEELQRLIGEYDKEPSEDYFEEMAREVAFESRPIMIYDIEALADIYPEVWNKADELDESWDDDIYSALQCAITDLMFYELLAYLPPPA